MGIEELTESSKSKQIRGEKKIESSLQNCGENKIENKIERHWRIVVG